MTVTEDGEPGQDGITRLTDDQARIIATSGMSTNISHDLPIRLQVPLPRDWDPDRRWHRARADAEKEWRESPEFSRGRGQRRYLLLALAAVVVITVCTTFTLTVFDRASWRDWSPVLFSGIVVSVVLYASWYIAAQRYRGVYRTFLEGHIADTDTTSAPAAAHQDRVPDKWLTDPDLQNLIVLNRTQIGVYQDIATGDAKRAARSSQIAMSIGFIILVVGAVVAVRTTDSTSKIVVGALASLGSVLSGYIGQTFLRAQDQAMKQLNYYFRQPLVTSYMLAAERLTLKLDDDHRQEMLTDVIKNVLVAASSAKELDSPPSAKSRGVQRRKPPAAQLDEDAI